MSVIDTNEHEIKSFLADTLYNLILDQVDAFLDDPDNYPVDGNGKSGHREYDLSNSVFNEKSVAIVEDKNNILYGCPIYSEGEIICKDTFSGKSIGTISIKVEVSYDIDKDVTTIHTNT
ncbi:MAG: hypothetical protein KQI78_10810 [Deltaproteobacteria bacterium]|nr:hypothetical protein [Deltaproteobacteria bacterium]